MMVNIYIYMCIYICICTVYIPGWWYTHPSEQYESQLGNACEVKAAGLNQ